MKVQLARLPRGPALNVGTCAGLWKNSVFSQLAIDTRVETNVSSVLFELKVLKRAFEPKLIPWYFLHISSSLYVFVLFFLSYLPTSTWVMISVCFMCLQFFPITRHIVLFKFQISMLSIIICISFTYVVSNWVHCSLSSILNGLFTRALCSSLSMNWKSSMVPFSSSTLFMLFCPLRIHNN